MVSCSSGTVGRPCWPLMLSFFLGFLSAHGVDMLFQIEGLVTSLKTTGIVISNEYQRSTVTVASCPCDCHGSNTKEGSGSGSDISSSSSSGTAQEEKPVVTEKPVPAVVATNPKMTTATDASAAEEDTTVTTKPTATATATAVKERLSADATVKTNIKKPTTGTSTTRTAMVPKTATAKAGFSQIVATANQRGLAPVKSDEPRQMLQVEKWEKSGLATTGGLNSNDRQLLGQLYHDANSVFEYGLGESTYIANHVGVERYAGIDSDAIWVGLARAKVAPHFRFYLADIGPTEAWGWPKKKRALPKQVLDYQLQPLIVEPLPFDVYMVDGRWRLPCMIASFLHASARGADPTKTKVCIHDCTDMERAHLDRADYHRADHLLQLIDHSQHKLCVYQRKPETTDEQLADFWLQHMDIMARRRLGSVGDTATDAITTTTSTEPTAFDVIVEAAYKRAIVETATVPHKAFDIDDWEASGLQTEGGLTRQDRVILGQVYYKATSVFEYGLGESTYIANYVGVQRYAGIDSDPVWIDAARKKVSSHFRFYLADIGSTEDWGYPKEKQALPKQVLDYQLYPLIVEPKPFDIYTVDGIWRLPCMIASFLHASFRGLDPSKATVVVLNCVDPASSSENHFSKNADDLLEKVTYSNSRICLYKRKPDTTDAQLQELWHENMDDMTRRLL